MADTYFVGLRGTADLVSNEREQMWRAGILRIFPNGMAPLTGLTALMSSEGLTDPVWNWWTKTLTTQRATVTGVYLDAGLGTAYSTPGTYGLTGATLYVKMSAADSAYFRAGHQVLLRDASDPTVDVNAKVLGVTVNGASSYITVRLLEADDNSSLGNLTNCDVALIVGNINPQGGMRPEAITQGPTQFYNYAQIFRNSLDMSRTLMKTKLRTVNAYMEAKRDALEQHSIEMEKAFWWSIKTAGTGSNGKPEYTTDGIMANIKTYGINVDYTTETASAYDGKTWLEAGRDWFDEHLEEMFRYGSQERLAFCGSGALLGIQRLVNELGFYTISAQTTSFGMKVLNWETPFGSVTFKTHPLFSYEATTRNMMVFIEPKNLRYRYIDDTFFKADNTDRQGGGTGKDGKEEEYLTEAGLEMLHPHTCMIMNGVGQDNS